MSVTANRMYHCGYAGYYVVDPVRDIAIRRYTSAEAAENEALRLRLREADATAYEVAAVYDGGRVSA